MDKCRTEYVFWKIGDIVEYVKDGQLNLSPPYQRAPIWPVNMKRGLIDSIFSGFPVPSIMLSRRTEDGEDVYNCIDGKQRCTTLVEFVDNKFKISLCGVSYNFKDLDREAQVDFKGKTLSISITKKIPIHREAEVFERINRTRALMGGELLNTYMTSPVVKTKNKIFACDSKYMKKLTKYLGDLDQSGKRKGMDMHLLAIILGLSVGPICITTSFPKNQEFLEMDEESWRKNYEKVLYTNLKKFIRMWKCVDPVVVGTVRKYFRGKNQLWKIGNLIGFQIYSIFDECSSDDTGHKFNRVSNIWSFFIKSFSETKEIYDRWRKCSEKTSTFTICPKKLGEMWKVVVSFYEEKNISVFDRNIGHSSDNDDDSGDE